MHVSKLRRLLNTLTDGEIRFFRQYARRHIVKGKAAYLRLFELTLSKEQFSDAEIKKKLNTGITADGYLSMKKYLYALVLKALVNLREDTSLYGAMLRELSAVEVLNDKQLFDDALRRIKKIKAATKDNDLYCIALTAAWFEELMMRATGYTLTSSTAVKQRQQELTELSAQIKMQFELSALFARYADLNRSGLMKAEEEEALLRLFANPLLQEENQFNLPATQRLFWVMKMTEARYFGNKELSLEYLLKIYSQVTGYPTNFFYHEQNLIYTTYLLVLQYADHRNLPMAASAFERLKSLKPHNNQNKYLQFRLSFQVELMMLKFQSKHDECMVAIMHYERRARTLRGTAFNILEYRIYQTIIGYLMASGHYQQCLPFVNSILNDPNTKKRGVPYQLYARVMNLIIHFELGNGGVLESSIRSLEYFMEQNDVKLEYMVHLLSFFKEIRKDADSFDHFLKVLGRAWMPLCEIPAERVHLFDVVECGWFQKRGLNLAISGTRPMFM